MNEHDAITEGIDLALPAASTTPDGGSGDASAAVSPPPASSSEWSIAKQARKPKVRPLLTKKKCRRIVAAALLAPMIGLSVGLVGSSSASATQPASSSNAAGPPGSVGGGSNARSAPAAGGSSGTVTSVSASSFTMTTSAGQKVTVDETSSTKYKKGSSSISVNDIKKGTHALVLGTVNSTTIKASQVIVQTSSGSTASTAATVVPFQKGSPTTSKQVGDIPSSYSEGSGTIESGTTATKATEAALA
jgi:membrane-bound inhibitor of C-type lysozyme